jgi:hypothetical protein
MDSIHPGMRPEEQSFTASATASLAVARAFGASPGITPLFSARDPLR